MVPENKGRTLLSEEIPVIFYLIGPDIRTASANGVVTDNYARALTAKSEHPSYKIFQVKSDLNSDEVNETNFVSAKFEL